MAADDESTLPRRTPPRAASARAATGGSTLRPGDSLGSYRLVEEIGRGGMGIVFRAFDSRLERDVAIKVLPTGALGDPVSRKAFETEARAMSRLSHPSLAALYALERHEDVDFLVMELISGRSLAGAGVIAERELIELAIQLAKAIDFAHGRGVIHRDLKPGNLMITADGYLKVLDFGLAKLVAQARKNPISPLSMVAESEYLGTIQYASPEQIRGEELDYRTDIYSIGVTLFELSTGTVPFANAEAILEQRAPAASSINPALSPGFDALISRAIERDREDRHASAKQLLDALETLRSSPAPTGGRSAAPATRDGKLPRAPEKALEAGAVIDHFRIRAKLGEGGMGVVYQAEDLQLGRNVALKMLPPALTRDTERRQRFMREARTGSAVLHPNLAVVFEVGDADGRVFIAMEQVPGSDLRRVLEREQTLEPARALKIAAAIARGVGAAHAAGVVHRDLKPENVMISETGEVKVLDFGLAKPLDAVDRDTEEEAASAAPGPFLSRAGKILGTPGYMSPEQKRGEPVDARTDVYALGVMLREMICGDRAGSNARLPSKIAALIDRSVAEDRGRRYADCRELGGALEAVERELAARPRRLQIAAAVAAVVAALATVPIIDHLSAECAVDLDCTSGRCGTEGTCVPWSGIIGDGQHNASVDPVVVASDGSVIVGGHFMGGLDLGCGPIDASTTIHHLLVARFSRTGVCTWSKSFGLGTMSAVAVTSDGHLYVAGTHGTNEVIAIDPDGTQRWRRDYPSFEGITVASKGEDLFIAGAFSGVVSELGDPPLSGGGGRSIVIARLTREGAPIWARALSAPAGSRARVTWLSADSRNDVVVMGVFEGELGAARSAGLNDVFIAKLSRDGVELWVKSIGGEQDDVYDGGVAFDASGNVFVAGEHRGADFEGEKLAGSMFVLKLSPAGERIWARGFGGSAPRDGFRRAVVDRSGDLIAFGRIISPVVRFDELELDNPTGSALVVLRFDGETGRARALRSFAATDATARWIDLHDPTGNLVIGGRLEGSLTIGEIKHSVRIHSGYFASIGPIER